MRVPYTFHINQQEYVDGMQHYNMYMAFKKIIASASIQILETCLLVLQSWFAKNWLTHNLDKTDVNADGSMSQELSQIMY